MNRLVRRLKRLVPFTRPGSLRTLEWAARYGEAMGARRSFVVQRPIDAEGLPLPWLTYSAIEYLRQLDLSDSLVFEFGSGYGSLFWAARARRVISVEHDPEWFDALQDLAPANLDLRFESTESAYLRSFERCDETPALVIIDGSFRKGCAEVVTASPKRPPLVVVDNADWHPEVCAVFTEAGVRRIDCIGPGPINRYAWATSFFICADPAIAFPPLSEVPRVVAGIPPESRR